MDSTSNPDAATGLYDVSRLAARLGKTPATIRTMRGRGKLPPPTSPNINGGAVWKAEIIEDFLTPSNEPIAETKSAADLPPILDLFAGCGGLSMGFQLAHFNVIQGFDNWPCAVDTYNANFNHPAELLDLSDVATTMERLEPFFEQEPLPAIIGGPPCQDFSSAGKRTEGARADLTEKYADLIAHYQPPFFVMENVARAATAGAYNRALDTMRNSGYFVSKIVLNASRCNVPQNRKRLIAFGTHSEGLTARILQLLQDNQKEHPMTLRDFFGNRLGVDHYYRHPRSYARRGVFSIDEPSPTIRGVNRPIPAGYPGHPGDSAPVTEARPLTTVERAEIQTFPREFVWVGSRTNTEQMIGNAVPVRLGKFIADAIAQAWREQES